MWTGFYPVKDFSNFSLHKKKAKCKDAFCFFYCFCEKWNDPTDAWNNMKNLSVYLKFAMVTSWKIKSIGAKERWGHRKEKKKKTVERGWVEREIRGLGRLGAAYNYYFLSIKTFRCARAIAVAYTSACSISLVLEPNLYLFYSSTKASNPMCSLWQLLSSLYTTVLERG